MSTALVLSAASADLSLPYDYMEPLAVDESILGDFQVLPPEVLEQIMCNVTPQSLLPLMLCNAIFYGLGYNERVWNALYSRYMPTTTTALSLVHTPELWLFHMPSSIRFLFKFAETLTSSSNTIALTAEEEVRVVMKVINNGSSSALIQQAGVYIVRRLAYFHVGAESTVRQRVETLRAVLGESDAVDALLRVIYRHPDNIDLLSGALCAIGNIVIDATNCQRLIEVAGIRLILAALKRHPKIVDVIDFGCFALCNVADEPGSRSLLVKEGALDYALTIISDSERPERELQPPLDLISSIMQETDTRSTHGSVTLDHLETILQRPSLTSGLLMHVLTALVITCEGTDENRDLACEKGLHKQVQSLQEQFPSDSAIFLKTSLCLFTFYWQQTDPDMVQRRFALIEAVCAAMNSYPNDVALQRTCAAMLSDLAHADGLMRQRIIALGGRQLVQHALAIGGGSDPDEEEAADAEWRLFAQYIRLDD